MGYIKSPVTALALVGNFLFAGVGSFVKVYNLQTKQICWIKKLFQTSVIHGIKIVKKECFSPVIIFGNKDLLICKLKTKEGSSNELIETEFKWRAKDWIWDVVFLYSENESNDPSFIAAALGHNSILLLDHKAGTELREVHCEEKCILYSAHFIDTSRPTWENLTLCSGTVFNQVVIWKPSIVEDMKGKVIKRIEAHDGVIFNMSFDLHYGLLVTASDDRSIRVWDCNQIKHLAESSTLPDSSFQIELLCKLYGHESRVWKAQCFYKDNKNYLISIGEDGYCIFWTLNKSESTYDDKSELEGSILKRMKSHKGKNVWSLVINDCMDIMSTGGGDGGIRLWRISDLINDKTVVTKHPFPNISSCIGVLKSIHACDNDIILGHTDLGILLRFEVKNALWSELHSDDNFKSYATMRVCDEAYMVAVGNTRGDVKVLCFDQSWSTLRFANTLTNVSAVGKIHNMSWEWKNDFAVLYASDATGNLTSYKVDVSNYSFEKPYVWYLPLAKHRWHMGAVSIFHESLMYVLCGDRRGSLHLYKKGNYEPLQTIHGAHGKNGVTSVKTVGNSIISTGRDGFWRKLEINCCQEKFAIVAENKAAQGMDWLECAIEMGKDSSEVGILGFHGRNFIAWSNETGDTLLSIECGGGHRDWSFRTKTSEGTLVAFIKESTLHVAKVFCDVTEENSVVEPHFHGGHISCMKHIQSWTHGIPPLALSLLVTGGEDTKIYLSLYIRKMGCADKLRKLCIIDDHISSVKSVASLTLEETATLSRVVLFTGGGRALLNCYCISIDKKSKNILKGYNLEKIASHNLNSEPPSHKRKNQDCDPEMRYMDLCSWIDETALMVAAACSDAVIRLFQVDIEQKKIFLTARSCTMHHCFLTVQSITIARKKWILSGATDGVIRIWESKPTHVDSVNKLSDCFHQNCHMSGINAIDVMNLPSCFHSMFGENTVLLATGGDDNAIHITLLKYDNNNFQVIYEHNMEKSHSTQITGLKLFFVNEANGVELVSSSIDQRLTKWSIYLLQNTLTMTYLNSKLTDIADASALEVWRYQSDVFYAVCGQGIQLVDHL